MIIFPIEEFFPKLKIKLLMLYIVIGMDWDFYEEGI